MFVDQLLETAEQNGWDLTYENSEEETYLFRRDSAAAEVSLRDGRSTSTRPTRSSTSGSVSSGRSASGSSASFAARS